MNWHKTFLISTSHTICTANSLLCNLSSRTFSIMVFANSQKFLNLDWFLKNFVYKFKSLALSSALDGSRNKGQASWAEGKLSKETESRLAGCWTLECKKCKQTSKTKSKNVATYNLWNFSLISVKNRGNRN